MRMSWLATATKELTLPSRSASSVASASRYASARPPSGHGQDVELARLDERQQQRERALELGDLDLERGFRTTTLAEPDAGASRCRAAPSPRHRTGAGRRHDRDRRRPRAAPSVGLVREAQQFAELEVRGSSWCRISSTVRGEHPASIASTADRSACSRSRVE